MSDGKDIYEWGTQFAINNHFEVHRILKELRIRLGIEPKGILTQDEWNALIDAEQDQYCEAMRRQRDLNEWKAKS